MKSVIIFLKIIQAAAAIISLLLLLNDCREHALSSGIKEEYPLQSSIHPTSYNIKAGLPSNYNLEKK